MTQSIRASDIEAQKVEYRWRRRIPKSMITVVAGRPDQGKGLFATRVAADVSRAGENVLYSAQEDSFELMTRPRLEAAGADLERVRLLRFLLPEQQGELDQLIDKYEAGLVVIDPLNAHLSRGVSRHSDSIRRMTNPLSAKLEETGASALIIEHSLKRVPKSGHPLDLIGGSGSGLGAAARAAFLLGVDPDDGDRRILAPAKFNIDTKPDALAFEVDTAEITMTGKGDDGKKFTFEDDQPFLLVDQELEAFDPMRLFERDKAGGRGRPSDKRASAAEWLTLYIAEYGPSKVAKIVEDAKQVQMSRRTLERAAADMGIVKRGKTKNTVWDLPDNVKQRMNIPVAQAGSKKPVTAGGADGQ